MITIPKTETRNKIVDEMREPLEKISKKVCEENPEQDYFVIQCTKLLPRIGTTTTTFYAYGGWNLLEMEIDWVSYIDNTGKLKLDLNMIREEFDIE